VQRIQRSRRARYATLGRLISPGRSDPEPLLDGITVGHNGSEIPAPRLWMAPDLSDPTMGNIGDCICSEYPAQKSAQHE
jgi:hypothetical protein